MQEFCKLVAEILEIDELMPNDLLSDFEGWDSLSVLSFVAMADSKFGVKLSGDEVRTCETPHALFEMVERRRTR